MSEQATPSRLQTGIYDLGYRAYEGQRLGRAYAVLSLFTYSLRAVFGLGRSWVAKLFAIGLAVIALIPALVQLAVAALFPEDFEILTFEDYFGFISLVLALFCAVAAPEMIGRDQRHQTLALYFSRSLSRLDYVSAKLGALVTGLLIVLLLPQLLLLVGNAVATDEIVDYLRDNVDEIAPILATSALIAAMMGSVSLAIAVQTSRRAWSTGAVIIFFVMATALGNALFATISGDDSGYALLISPFDTLQGAVFWIFSAIPEPGSDLEEADLEGILYLGAAAGYTLLGLAVVYRRFLGMGV